MFPASGFPSSMGSDRLKIGMGLIGLGAAVTFIGVLLLFDRALLSIGNIVLAVGLLISLGPRKMKAVLFGGKRRIPGSVLVIVGFCLIAFFGWVYVGYILELVGSFVLFKAYMGTILNIMRDIPGVGFVVSKLPSKFFAGAEPVLPLEKD